MRQAAYRLYLIFLVCWFLHVGERLSALGAIRPDLLLILTIGALIGFSEVEAVTGVGADHDTISNARGPVRTRRLITTLLVYSTLTIPFVEWPGSVLHTGLPNIIKAVVFYFFTARLITTERRLAGLLIVFIAAMTFRVLEPLFLHVTTGYWGSSASMGDWESMDRLSGSPYDIINPNGLAFVILTVVPFLHYLGPMTIAGTVAYVTILPLLIWALLLTGSRSGIIGLAAVLLVIWWKSRRKLLMVGVLAVAFFAVAPNLSGDLKDRYLSIFSSNTKNAKTAEGRMEGVRSDFRVALRRPIFGHGLGTSAEANAHFGDDWLPSHNLYAEAAQEIGFVGLAILVAMLWSIASNLHVSLRELKRAGTASPLLGRMAAAAQVWLAMDILFSFASYGLSSYEWYFAAGLSEVIRRFAVRVRETAVVQPEPLPQFVACRPLKPRPAAVVAPKRGLAGNRTLS